MNMRAYENFDGSWVIAEPDPERITGTTRYASFGDIPEPIRSKIAYLNSFGDATEWIDGFGKKIEAGVFWLDSSVPTMTMYERLAARGLIAVGIPDQVYILFLDGRLEDVYRRHDDAYAALLEQQELGKRASILVRKVKGDV